MFCQSLFTCLIIRLFQLVFSVGTVFFSHNKSTNSVFQPAYQPNQTGPQSPGSSFLYNARNAKRNNAREELVSEQKPNKDLFVHPGRGLVTYE
jgi:hypothetical protein